MITKEELRKVFLMRRLALTPEAGALKSAKIADALVKCDLFRRARALSLYYPIQGEVSTDEIFRDAIRAGKIVLFPRVTGSTLEFSPVTDLRDLHPGAFHILEPAGGSAIPLSEIDLLVVPGVAFDREGNRLGYGGGYYDSILNRRPRPSAVALSYECQISAERLPTRPGDARVDMILTEERVFMTEGGPLT